MRKIKIKTNHEPFSKSLYDSEIVMKIDGSHEHLFAARPHVLKDYFVNICLVRIGCKSGFSDNSTIFVG